jgi:hypothetical protein
MDSIDTSLPGPITNPSDTFVTTFSLNDSLKRTKGIKIMHFNAHSILPKFAEFKFLLSTYEFDIISVNETWVNATVADGELYINGYELFRKDRVSRSGGVALYVKECFKPLVVTDLMEDELECLWLKLTTGHGNTILICSCYRKPSSLAADFNRILINFERVLLLEREIIKNLMLMFFLMIYAKNHILQEILLILLMSMYRYLKL